MSKQIRTRLSMTQTAIGMVFHQRRDGLMCPVMIQVGEDKAITTDEDGLPVPVMTGEHFKYAIPGGGSFWSRPR